MSEIKDIFAYDFKVILRQPSELGKLILYFVSIPTHDKTLSLSPYIVILFLNNSFFLYKCIKNLNFLMKQKLLKSKDTIDQTFKVTDLTESSLWKT